MSMSRRLRAFYRLLRPGDGLSDCLDAVGQPSNKVSDLEHAVLRSAAADSSLRLLGTCIDPRWQSPVVWHRMEAERMSRGYFRRRAIESGEREGLTETL